MMDDESIPCPVCWGRMTATKRYVKVWNGSVIVEIEWRCKQCGSVKGAVYGPT